jgi:uroporphyrinogen decarboxylase
MNHKERFLAALNHEPVDMLACGDGLWGETYAKYVKEGKLQEGEDATTHFDMSWRHAGWLNSGAKIPYEEVILEEDEETKLTLNANGAKLRYWKNHSGTPEHVAFTVTDRAGWDKEIKPHLVDFDERRLSPEGFANTKKQCAEEGRLFCWAGVAPFEQIHPVCGHENMCIGMALDPDWVKDMVMTYADFTIMHLEELFAREGNPDAVWFYEDMGMKERPFMSPEMYRELFQPGHKKLFDFAHARGLKVIVHSCGFVEQFVPGLVEAGLDCLQAMEVKAGMDMPRMAKQFPGKLAFCGNIDIRVLESNDFDAIDEELNRKIIPTLEAGCGYILHTDHSIPPGVEHDTLKYFFEHGRRITERI